MPDSGDLDLPYGFKDARVVLLTLAIVGEFLQGGLIFGWNALAIMLKAQGNYDGQCPPDVNARCAWQESHLAVLWTIGVFALNFGPVIVGPILDYVGPKLTAIFGAFLNVLALILLSCSNSHDFNALAPGAVIMGLAGITFHLSQFHMSNLFPRSRGFISSLLVAGFTGCGAIFYFLDLIFIAAGSTRGAYRLIMILYGVVCGLWIPLNFWMMPWHALQVGQMYLYVGKWKFKVMERKEVERQAVALRMTALDGHKHSQQHQHPQSPQNGASRGDASTLHDLENGHSDDEIDRDMALAYMGLKPGHGSGKLADSADPVWLDRESPPPAVPAQHDSHASIANGEVEGERRRTEDVEAQQRSPGEPEQLPGLGQLPSAPSSRPDSAATPRGIGRPPVRDHNMLMHGERGALVFEPRRFVELRKKPFWQQFMSAESTGMGIFYTLNVFCIQFYLGTTRLQLEHKGGEGHIVTAIANVVPAFGFIGIPVIGWLLDRMGYGVTLATINFLGVLASFFQAMPSVWFQIVTLIVWCAGRFFLYTSYYSIFGALFGFTNFGRMVAIDNTINGLFGLLQLPLTNWGLHGLGGNFTAINIIQVAILLPLFIFCWYMYNWETNENDQIPILPVEGEELPCNIKGPRLLREANFLQSLEKKLTGAGAIAA